MDPFEKMKLAAQAVREAMPSFPSLFEASAADVREGERYLRLGKHAEAERWFDRELANLKARGPMRARHSRVFLGYATAQFRQGKHDDARETVETALDLLQGSGHRRHSSEEAACLDLLGSICLEQEQFERARQLFDQALAAEQESRPRDTGNLVLRHRRLAEALRKAGRLAEARTYLTAGLEAAEQSLGSNDTARAAVLLDLGECESGLGDHTAANEHLKAALEVHRAACGYDSEEVARNLQALASCAQAAGDLETAVGYYEQALRLRERQLGGNAAEFAMLLMSLAGVHSLLGRFAPAMELQQQAVSKLVVSRDSRLGDAFESLASTYLGCGRLDDAVSNLRKAREFWEREPEKYGPKLKENRRLIDDVLSRMSPEDAELADPGYWDEDSPEMFGPDAVEASGDPLLPEAPAASAGGEAREESGVGVAPEGSLPEPGDTSVDGRGSPSPALPSGGIPPPRTAPGSGGRARGGAYQPYPLTAPPVPSGAGPGGVAFNFVRPDGSPAPPTAMAPSIGPLQLTIVVPEGGMPREAVAVPAKASGGKITPFPHPGSSEFTVEEEGEAAAGRNAEPLPAQPGGKVAAFPGKRDARETAAARDLAAKETPAGEASGPAPLQGWEELGFDLLPM